MAVPKKKKIKKVITKNKTVKKTVRKRRTIKKTSPLELKRVKNNPIIVPQNNLPWESKATFNPTAFYNDGKVHIVYRAIGDSDNSVLGYVVSEDGVSISERSLNPIYSHHSGYFGEKNSGRDVPLISYSSGGGWGGGCEDPRITLLGDKVYMLYTAFDGWGSVRIALTSISLDDFISKRWNWKKPVLISPPHEIHKNWVLFPEKIKGKYAILHSISPSIMISYFKTLDELDGHTYVHSVHQASPLWAIRDPLIRGVGPSPLKTKYGWLVLYHKMEPQDTHRYKLWAMILDAQNPEKILYSSDGPILEPDLWYENQGYKGGVVYSCGAVIKNGELFVYYGGADKVSCVATANLDRFLKELVHSGGSKLKSRRLKA